jgi:photosystem II stability/assembly factor-like uncharacterized protein
MKLITHLSIVIFIFSCLAFASAQQPTSPLVHSFQSFKEMREQSNFKLSWVPLGPTLNSARADVVHVDKDNPGTMYVGFGSGGLWKTTNNGLSWKSIFENEAIFSIGDFAVAPSNADILYLGTGEHLKKPRNFTLPGTGMYKSEDAGKTWQHIGLDDSWSIAEIAIHPNNPDIVLVSVLGHLWTKNENRGLFRTENGGKTWDKVLFVDDKTGGNDIIISASDPNIMYTTLWEVNPGISGENSGIYKSKDGGKTWSSCKTGLPTGPNIGRIGITVSFTNPNKAYALIDNLNNPKEFTAEVYKTEDGGNTWTKTHGNPFKIFSAYGWYFTNITINPLNDEEIYCLGIRLAHSIDGGKTFTFIGGKVSRMNPSFAQGLHLDQCELWINSYNPNHLALGNDGGFYVSYDKGDSWMHYNNIPVGEFYDITIDTSTNTIYGGTQDNATVFGPAKELNTQFNDPWKYVWIDPWDGGDGCVSQIDPIDKNIIYYSQQHGEVVRLDKSTDETANIIPKLPDSIKDTLHFNYVTPYFISTFQHQTLYQGGNFIFKSIDRGDTWKVISPNLTNSADKEKKSFASGAFVESQIKKGLLYVGTDRGAFWVSKNDGDSWEEHDKNLPNHYIRSICSSRFKESRVYMAMTGINTDDLHKYLFVSENYGTTWINISHGLPDEPVNVIMEDPKNENILYAGSIRGVYISIDRGQNWSCLGSELPQTAVADLKINEVTMDLVVATHGRGIFKLNLKPIHSLTNNSLDIKKDHLFEVETIQRPWFNSNGGEANYRSFEKADFSFWLKEAKTIKLALINKVNNEIWQININGNKGFNHFRWDITTEKRKSDAPYFVHYDKFIEAGNYTLRAYFGETVAEQSVKVVAGNSPYLIKE